MLESSPKRERSLKIRRQKYGFRYDRLLENIHVLIQFDGVWVECPTFHGSSLTCQPISP